MERNAREVRRQAGGGEIPLPDGKKQRNLSHNISPAARLGRRARILKNTPLHFSLTFGILLTSAEVGKGVCPTAEAYHNNGDKKMTTEKTYPVFYRAGYRHNGRMDTTDKQAGQVFHWTMEQILNEVNSYRSADWTDYTKEDWEEGLDEWTCFHPVTEYRLGGKTVREYDDNGKWRLLEVIADAFGKEVAKDAPFIIATSHGTVAMSFPSLAEAFKEYATMC